jgi:hypothetical protein
MSHPFFHKYPICYVPKVNDLFEYGVEFTVDENDRADLIKILNQVQIKMRKDILFSEGSFVSSSKELYFNSMIS